ncbi:MAG: family 16 glycoside hydrolase [Pseudomonadota bacterium]
MQITRTASTTNRAVLVPKLAIACTVLAAALLLSGCNRSVDPTSPSAAPPDPTTARLFDFEGAPLDTVPAGFVVALNGGGRPTDWRTLRLAGTAGNERVVGQLSAQTISQRYPLLIRSDVSIRDVDVSVRFKTLSGEVDASGGVVFRYRDPDNFYVVRANALENNVVAYKTENGKRSNIGVNGHWFAYGVEADVPHRTWNVLRVIARAETFEVFLNGVKLFDVDDETFVQPGAVGLWTKADAVTLFDDLTLQSLD